MNALETQYGEYVATVNKLKEEKTAARAKFAETQKECEMHEALLAQLNLKVSSAEKDHVAISQTMQKMNPTYLRSKSTRDFVATELAQVGSLVSHDVKDTYLCTLTNMVPTYLWF